MNAASRWPQTPAALNLLDYFFWHRPAGAAAFPQLVQLPLVLEITPLTDVELQLQPSAADTSPFWATISQHWGTFGRRPRPSTCVGMSCWCSGQQWRLEVHLSGELRRCSRNSHQHIAADRREEEQRQHSAQHPQGSGCTQGRSVLLPPVLSWE